MGCVKSMKQVRVVGCIGCLCGIAVLVAGLLADYYRYNEINLMRRMAYGSYFIFSARIMCLWIIVGLGILFFYFLRKEKNNGMAAGRKLPLKQKAFLVVYGVVFLIILLVMISSGENYRDSSRYEFVSSEKFEEITQQYSLTSLDDFSEYGTLSRIESLLEVKETEDTLTAKMASYSEIGAIEWENGKKTQIAYTLDYYNVKDSETAHKLAMQIRKWDKMEYETIVKDLDENDKAPELNVEFCDFYGYGPAGKVLVIQDGNRIMKVAFSQGSENEEDAKWIPQDEWVTLFYDGFAGTL